MQVNAVDSGENDRCIHKNGYDIYQLNNPEIRAKELVYIYKNGYRDYPEYADTGGKGDYGYLESLWQTCPENFLVAENNGELLGFIVVDKCHLAGNGEPVGEITEIVVSHKHQGRKIGPTLLYEGISRLSNSGLQKIGLWVGKDNNPAIMLYKKFGFKKMYIVDKWLKMERRGKPKAGDIMTKRNLMKAVLTINRNK